MGEKCLRSFPKRNLPLTFRETKIVSTFTSGSARHLELQTVVSGGITNAVYEPEIVHLYKQE